MFRSFIAALILMTFPITASAEDKREGYYYPPITSEEVFDRTVARAPKAVSAVRTAFITEITKGDGAAHLTRAHDAILPEEQNPICGDLVRSRQNPRF